MTRPTSRRRLPRRYRLAAQTALAALAAVVLLNAGPREDPPAPATPPSTAKPAIEAAGFSQAGSPTASTSEPSFFESGVRWASATVLTISLLLVTIAFLKRGRFGRPTAGLLAVRQRLTLGRGASIALVEAGRSYLLVGVGTGGVTSLKEFQGEEAESFRAALPAGARGAFAALLAGIASRQEGRS